MKTMTLLAAMAMMLIPLHADDALSKNEPALELVMCRGWNKMTAQERLHWLVGFESGVTIGANGDRRITDPYFSTATHWQLITEITDICKRPDQAEMPIDSALKLATLFIKNRADAESKHGKVSGK